MLRSKRVHHNRKPKHHNKEHPCDCFTDDKFSALTAEDACKYVINGGVFEEFTNPVTAACAVWKNGELEVATLDA